ncbi:uncharacterized protein [Amphiura filiformis]|uniref:uncharacterized protein isoform X2 n=1 Tax=Amphiura filiformis TaxID=82378 RepID=UPI003B21D5CB
MAVVQLGPLYRHLRLRTRTRRVWCVQNINNNYVLVDDDSVCSGLLKPNTTEVCTELPDCDGDQQSPTNNPDQGTSTATSLSTRSEYKPLTTMPEKGYSTFPTKPDISMPLSVTRPGTARTSTSTGAIVGAVIGCIFATSILWILAIIVWKKVCKKTKPSLNTSTQLGDNGYVEYKANTQEPYAELTASSTSGSKQNESTRNTQPVIGEDGYTEYNRRRQQESFEELQKSTSPDTKGTSTSDTDYEVHIDITHGATPAEAKHAKEEKPEVTSIKHRSAEVSHENNDDNEYSYAYADVPKTDASDMNNQNKQVPFSNGNNDESSGTYVNSSVVRKMP